MLGGFIPLLAQQPAAPSGSSPPGQQRSEELHPQSNQGSDPGLGIQEAFLIRQSFAFNVTSFNTCISFKVHITFHVYKNTCNTHNETVKGNTHKVA